MLRRAVIAAILFALLFSLFSLAGCGGADEGTNGGTSGGSAEETTGGSAEETGGSTGGGSALDGRGLVDTKCSMCHPTDRVYSANKSRDEWVTTIERMKKNGLVVTQEEYDAILEFLATP